MKELIGIIIFGFAAIQTFYLLYNDTVYNGLQAGGIFIFVVFQFIVSLTLTVNVWCPDD